MMTDKELKERAEVYRQLLDYPAFQYFMTELHQRQLEIRDGIAESITPGDDKLYDKGMRAGIRYAIELPDEAIKESEQINTNMENS
jgi:hypothetical protein